MFKILERISSRKTRTRSQTETRGIQAKQEKWMRRQQETERFRQQRQAMNDAVFSKKDPPGGLYQLLFG